MRHSLLQPAPSGERGSARQMRITRRTWTAAIRATTPNTSTEPWPKPDSEVNETSSRVEEDSNATSVEFEGSPVNAMICA